MTTTDIKVTRQAITYTTTLATLPCGVCGIPFAIPAEMLDKLQAKGVEFWCPNGDKIHYSETTEQKLRAENKRIRQERDMARTSRDAARDQAAAAERSAAAYRGRVTRLKNRAAAGVCPCCNRSFENLRRHMTSQHPDFATADS